MIDFSAYCSICNKEDGKETPVKKVKLVNGTLIFELICGHNIIEKFR